MNRLQAAFEEARKSGKKLLCPFLTAGYPTREATADLLMGMQEGGAGVVELGIPFSDPVADGPVIQSSYTQALMGGATVKTSLEAVAVARKMGLKVPVMAMVSYSIIFKKGTREFAALCKGHEVDGVVLPDVPVEEAPVIVDVMRDQNLRTALLVAPTTGVARREAIARLCDGFVYYLSVSGITGERKSLPVDIGPNVAALRKVTGAPICVGFGISTAEQVRAVVHGEGAADGAIVGSAVIRRLGEVAGRGIREQREALKGFVGELARGLG